MNGKSSLLTNRELANDDKKSNHSSRNTSFDCVFFGDGYPDSNGQTIVEDSNLSLFSYNGSEGSLTISISSFSSTIGFDVVPPASPPQPVLPSTQQAGKSIN